MNNGYMEAKSGGKKNSQHTAALVQLKVELAELEVVVKMLSRYGSRGIGAKGQGMIGKDEGM